MIRTTLVAAVFWCGCSNDPCVSNAPDGCLETSVKTLSCDVRWADGGVASGVSAQCTGPEDAGATTDASGRFQISITVTTGGLAGWSDDCGAIEFREGATPLDGGVRAWALNGGRVATGCLVQLE